MAALTLREALEEVHAWMAGLLPSYAAEADDRALLTKVRAALDATVQGPVTAEEIAEVLMREALAGNPARWEPLAQGKLIAALVAERTRPAQAPLTLDAIRSLLVADVAWVPFWDALWSELDEEIANDELPGERQDFDEGVLPVLVPVLLECLHERAAQIAQVLAADRGADEEFRAAVEALLAEQRHPPFCIACAQGTPCANANLRALLGQT